MLNVYVAAVKILFYSEHPAEGSSISCLFLVGLPATLTLYSIIPHFIPHFFISEVVLDSLVKIVAFDCRHLQVKPVLIYIFLFICNLKV